MDLTTRKVTVFLFFKRNDISAHKNADQPTVLSPAYFTNQFSYHQGCLQDLKGMVKALLSIFILTSFFNSQTNIFKQRSMGPCLFLLL